MNLPLQDITVENRTQLWDGSGQNTSFSTGPDGWLFEADDNMTSSSTYGRGVPQHVMSTKDCLIVAFIFVLWFYSLLLIYRLVSFLMDITKIIYVHVQVY